MKKFHTKSSKQIAEIVQVFLEEDFFSRYPYLENKISIIIVGSIATSNYDKYSDIDLDVLFSNEKDFKSLLEIIMQYKKELRVKNIPIQIHRPKTYKKIIESLNNWDKDTLLREYSQAIIVSDPQNHFKSIQDKYQWYPKVIFTEKLQWLFAEMIFEYEERYLITVKRKDPYFSEVVKMKILKYLFSILLMSNQKYPAFDKHLYQDVKKIKTLPNEFIKIANKLLRSHNLSKNENYLKEAVELVESYLIEKRFIKKETRQYWMDFRPKHKIDV